ncbi:MAG: DNA gyrase inhibitor YacG [Nitrospirota bacterium]|nr:DNA gyrase inhibitor YacG [Nitrospirota bacterium]
MRVTCPTCRQVTTWEENKHRPFCSERCRTMDLGAWASESYRFAGEPSADLPTSGPESDTPED